jgi:hypothetical protein
MERTSLVARTKIIKAERSNRAGGRWELPKKTSRLVTDDKFQETAAHSNQNNPSPRLSKFLGKQVRNHQVLGCVQSVLNIIMRFMSDEEEEREAVMADGLGEGSGGVDSWPNMAYKALLVSSTQRTSFSSGDQQDFRCRYIHR